MAKLTQAFVSDDGCHFATIGGAVAHEIEQLFIEIGGECGLEPHEDIKPAQIAEMLTQDKYRSKMKRLLGQLD